MNFTQLKGRVCLQFLMVFWLLCQPLSGAFCAEPSASSDAIIPLAEILKRWQGVKLEDTVMAAENGDLTAQHYLGYYHLEGLGGKANKEEGIRWYLRAAASGFPNSLNNLGVVYRHGNGVPKDEAKALEYFQEAGNKGLWRALRFAAEIAVTKPGGAEKKLQLRRKLELGARAGDAEAQMQLSYFLLDPPGGGFIESENALYMLKKAVEQGRGEAYTTIGNIYMETSGKVDYAQAHKWHTLGAEKGQPASLTALSWMCFNAMGVPFDKAKALELLNKAAEQKYLPAMVNMGRYYAADDIKNFPHDFQLDYAKAAQWYERAAMLGSGRGAYYLGRLIVQGRVSGGDKAQARVWLEKARDLGVTDARNLLLAGEMHDIVGTPEEVAGLERLAMNKYAPAMSRLAEKYLEGKGVPRDAIHAVRLYRFAMYFGDFEAHGTMAVLGEDKKPLPGLDKNQAILAGAYSQLLESFKQKDAAYFKGLGERYVKGEEVPKDLVEAVLWLQVAAKYGSEGAQQRADQIIVQLDDGQRELMRYWMSGLNRPWQ